MLYAYKVRDPLGNVLEGEVDAESRDNASLKLEREGYQVLTLAEMGGELNLFPRSIKKNEIIYTASQLAIMVDTGINLATALDAIAQQEENPTLKKVLIDLKERVESGDDFSSALSKHPRHFDKTFVSMVKAAEETGTLGEMLDRIAGYMRGELETRGKVRAAMAYPAVMLGVAISVTIFLLTFVMPKFTPLFERKGTKLPKPTQLMMTTSHLLIDYWWAWLLGIAGLVAAYILLKRTPSGRQWLDHVKINLPILGPMFRKVTLSRSIRTLGTMIQAGVSMLDAIQLTAEVAGNYLYERAWLHVLDQITQGNQIHEALRGNSLFPSTLIQMIGSGEETGKLDYVLNKVSVYYDKEVEMSLKATTSLIEPLMIVVMGVIVGTIGLSLLLPIFSLSRG